MDDLIEEISFRVESKYNFLEITKYYCLYKHINHK